MNVPGFLEAHVAQLIATAQSAAEKKCLWAVVYGLSPFQDGDRWCVLLGKDMQRGVCGFGKTPFDAIWEFEQAMSRPVGGGTK